MWDQILVVILFLVAIAQARGLSRMAYNFADLFGQLGNFEKTRGWGKIAGHCYLLQTAWTVWFIVYLTMLAWRYFYYG